MVTVIALVIFVLAAVAACETIRGRLQRLLATPLDQAPGGNRPAQQSRPPRRATLT